MCEREGGREREREREGEGEGEGERRESERVRERERETLLNTDEIEPGRVVSSLGRSPV